MPQITDAVYPRVAHYAAVAGASGPFAIPFPFASANDITVYLDGVETSDFTVTQVSEYGTTGNEVELIVPLVTDKLVTVASSVERFPLDEEVISNDAIKVELDRVWAAQQEIDYQLTTVPRFTLETGTVDYNFIVAPTAGRLVVFGADGFELGPAVQGLNVVASDIPNKAALLADILYKYVPSGDDEIAVVAGQLLRVAEGFLFEVAASGAVDHHFTTAGGVKLYEAGPDFSTRARLKQYRDRGGLLVDGLTYTAEGVEYKAQGGATSIADMHGLVLAGVALDPGVSTFARTLLDDAAATNVLTTLGVSAFIQTLLDDASAGDAQTTLGISAFVKTLLDDADAAGVLTSLGVSSFIQTLLDDASATTARGTLGLGDAAVATLISSLLDTTVGRVLTTGAFGLGLNNVGMSLLTDLDANRITGLFNFGSGATGGPGFNGALLHLIRNPFNNGVNPNHVQLAVGENRIMYRVEKSGVWADWRGINGGTGWLRVGTKQICFESIITAGGGSGTTWTYPVSFGAAPMVVGIANATSNPRSVTTGSPSTTAASIHCWDLSSSGVLGNRAANTILLIAVGDAA